MRFHAVDKSAFGTFCAFGSAACLVVEQQVGVKGGCHSRTSSFPVAGKGDESVHQLCEADAFCGPEIEGKGARDGVDFIDIDMLCISVHHEVDAAYAGSAERAECFLCQIIDMIGFRFGKGSGDNSCGGSHAGTLGAGGLDTLGSFSAARLWIRS